MTLRVDVNCDVGESYGVYRLGTDEQILECVSSVNIACGFHAGDPNVMQRTVQRAAEKGVGIGAHPGLPDRIGFGRRVMAVDPEDVVHFTIYQIGALQAFATSAGTRVRHVKPHGALYGMAFRDAAIAQALAEAVRRVDCSLILFGQAGSELVIAGRRAGLPVAEEVFVDRTYRADGTLTPRDEPHALVDDVDEAAARAVRLVKEGKVQASNGRDLSLPVDTLCIHGDHPSALPLAQRLRHVFLQQQIRVEKPGVP